MKFDGDRGPGAFGDEDLAGPAVTAIDAKDGDRGHHEGVTGDERGGEEDPNQQADEEGG